MQSTNTVFMVRPTRFGFNTETACSNRFQQDSLNLSPEEMLRRALAEFDTAVARLREAGVQVMVFDDTAEPHTPDAVFPNNWLTMHPDGRVLLYPMCAPNRRLERRTDILDALRQQFEVTEVIDLSAHEKAGRFLEGTGSIIFDHDHRVAYACLSIRTDIGLFEGVAARLGYRAVSFRSLDEHGHAIYHTNVMMCLGEQFAVVCLESIASAAERTRLTDILTETGHDIVPISLQQVTQFAGNMLPLRSVDGRQLLVMSQSAHDALTPAQRETLAQYAQLLPLAIPTIESVGGGSARCMLAEVFLPAKQQ